MTESDDSYPSAWKPSWAPDDEIEPTAAEAWLASLSDEEYFNLTKRVRGGEHRCGSTR